MQISLKFVPKDLIDNVSALVQITGLLVNYGICNAIVLVTS